MKLQREKFLAAAMMLSTASAGAGGCRSKVDQGNEGINAEGAQTIGQSSPNGELGADLSGGQNRAIQQQNTPIGVKGGAFAPLRAPTGEGIVAAPTNEKIIAAPTTEKGALKPFITPRK